LKKRNIFLGGALVLLAGLAFWAGLALLAPAAPAEPALAAKILVTEMGIYEITARDLRALGWENVDPASLRLEYQGEPYPFVVRGEGADLRLYFHGFPPLPPLDHSTAHNAFFLYRDAITNSASTSSAGKLSINLQSPIPNLQSPIPNYQLPSAYTATLHLEENEHYAPRSLENHTWYWRQIPAPQTETFDFEISGLAPGVGSIRAAFFASTESPAANPDHHVRLSLAGQVVAEASWDGQGWYVLEGSIPDGALTDGENTLTLEAVGDTGVPADIVLLDWIEIDFPREGVAEEGRLAFTAPGEAFSLEGFRAPLLVLDLSKPGGSFTLWESASPEGAFTLPTIPGNRYIAAGAGGFLEPVDILAAQFSPDLRTFTGADYVAIGPPDLLEPLGPLLAHREAQGLRTLAVPVEAVMDQFGFGRTTSLAIRSFLAFATQNWDTAPRFVLLVGDWTHDPLGYTVDAEQNRLPSIFVFTTHGGETVSDVQVGNFDADPWPDVALGRVPAQTTEQVAVFVEKTIQYEQTAPTLPWTHRLLAVADGQDASFAGDARTFLGYFSAGYEGQLVSPEAGAGEGGYTQIEQALDTGVLFMSYFGHGSITQLGKDAIFTVENAAALNNGEALPIMINITCLAGLFTHPEVESLSEAMLWNPDGGAVAALGASSLTLPADQAHLSRAFVAALLANPGGTLGEILLAAQQAMPMEAGAGALEVLDTFLLFGDPALVIPAP